MLTAKKFRISSSDVVSIRTKEKEQAKRERIILNYFRFQTCCFSLILISLCAQNINDFHKCTK